MVNGNLVYATGGNDDCVAIWDLGECAQAPIEKATSSNGMNLRRLVSDTLISDSRGAPRLPKAICVLSYSVINATIC